MTNLVKYEAACRALAEAKAVDEVKDIRDKADAMRIYAMQAKNKVLEIDAAEIRIRAERRLGEMIAAQKKTVGLNKGGNPSLTPREQREVTPTLKETGISHDLSSRAQKLAAVPEDEFEAEVADWRERVQEEGKRVTTRLEQAGERAQRNSEPEPERDGPSDEELAAMEAAEAADREIMAKLLDSDDALATAHAEITRLNAVVAGLQQRVNGLLNEKAEAIKLAKREANRSARLQKELDQYKKVAA